MSRQTNDQLLDALLAKDAEDWTESDKRLFHELVRQTIRRYRWRVSILRLVAHTPLRHRLVPELLDMRNRTAAIRAVSEEE